ncbi:hypothetical protein FRC10_001299 [Ceratobasidium sp. 414]|nr:hypothetical protein FRC10_001299 [Ceratobasidium sp. 414]
MTEPLSNQNRDAFRAWAAENQIFIHPALEFVPSSSGHDVCANMEILPHTKVLSCPFDIAITAPQSQVAIESLFQDGTPGITGILQGWNGRQLVCMYIVLHIIWAEAKRSPLPSALKHQPYLNMLPPPSTLLTPLYFDKRELDMVKGSNLYHATLQRRQEWQTEWKQCSEGLSSIDPELASAFTWEIYLAAATYLSSRAFPSTLLSSSPTNASPESSYPVLLPGIDSLNHRRATPVSWISATSKDRDTLDLVLHDSIPATAECFNNYGPKPNSELILGYGFALPYNPDDTILLSLAASNSTEASMVEIGRNAKNAEHLWELVMSKVAEMYQQDPSGEDEADQTWEIELEAAETIIDLTEKRLERLPEVERDVEGVRQEVGDMVEYYLEGQRAILKELVEWTQLKRTQARNKAMAQGIDVDLDPGPGDGGDNQ